MDIDPNSLDPELRMAKLGAIASVSFGILSLCLAIIPACGGLTSLLGVATGWYSLRTEHTRTAMIGVIISGLGLLITIVYTLFLFFFRKMG